MVYSVIMGISEHTLRALEFHSLLDEIASGAKSPVSRDEALAIRPQMDEASIAERMGRVDELRTLMQTGGALAIRSYGDIRGVVRELMPEGSALEPQELLALTPALENMEAAFGMLAAEPEQRPLLCGMIGDARGFPAIRETIERSIDADGQIKDSASFELAELRGRIRSLERRISRKLEALVRDPSLALFLHDTFITKRSGRWVIPVRMDSKGMVQGVVHDVSRSGETAFMEPLEVIGMSNELENLSAEARAEEIRILKRICASVRSVADELLSEFSLLVRLDVIHAIALYAERYRAESPSLSPGGPVRLMAARHPLLVRHLGAKVVPLDIIVGGDERVMVITGPNAGGKTITIKTVGLLLLMARSGIPITAASESRVPVSGDVLVDIGDEQSIAESQSTFSAHVANLARIIKAASEGSIALLDELGTGTDPEQGAALGSAVLMELMRRGATVLATTHLMDIVGFVHKTDRMANASMAIDPKNMRPLYRLVPGEPGQSHALEAALRFGMPSEVVDFARQRLGSMQAELQQMLMDMKADRRRLEHEISEARRARKEAEQSEREARERMKAIETEKREARRLALDEAQKLLREYRQRAEQIIEEARQRQAATGHPERAAARKLDELRAEAHRQSESLKDAISPRESLPVDEIRPGMRVYVHTISKEAQVTGVDLAQGRVRVRAGNVELQVPASAIGPASQEPKEPHATRSVTYSVAEQHDGAFMEIKLLGLRVDEAMEQLEPFLNRAASAGLPMVRIIHGVGTGALRSAVREHLAGHPLVEDFSEPRPEAGGAGVTEVRLRQ